LALKFIADPKDLIKKNNINHFKNTKLNLKNINLKSKIFEQVSIFIKDLKII